MVLLKAAVGGLFSLAFFAAQIPMNPIFAIHVGVAWPLILAEMGRTARQKRTIKWGSVVRFWRVPAPDVRPGD